MRLLDRIRYGRDAPARHGRGASIGFLADPDQWKILVCGDYRPIGQSPEVQMCVGIFADLIAAMTIHLMANADGGDIRIRNELSRKLDIDPAKDMTRSTFMSWLTRTLMVEGNAVVLPIYRDGYLDDLVPVSPARVSFLQEGRSYSVTVDGIRHLPDEVLHFAINPDPDYPWKGRGYAFALKDAVRAIDQANMTRKAVMESPSPSLIVKVDGLTEEFASPEGRRKLREQYLDATEKTEPWFIPSESFSVEQVKPMSMMDLAIKENLELDKRAVAAIFGVPPFMVGIGNFNREEFQHFLSTRVAVVARVIEQEMTKKLLWSPDLYIRLNSRSLYNYSIGELISAGSAMVDRMAMRRNEWRDWLGMPPDPDMDDLLALENYIPADRLGDQKKLEEEGGDDSAKTDNDGAGSVSDA